MALSKHIGEILHRVARETGVKESFLRAICLIESSGNPKTISRSGYKGLFQLSTATFRKHGGKGSIFDPYQNALVAAKLFKANRELQTRRLGRLPTDAEMYLGHQQGISGSTAHILHRDRAAWASMHSTTEGKRRGAAWSKRAIWGNLPTQAKTKFGKVENVTSGDFVDWWVARYDRAVEQTKEA